MKKPLFKELSDDALREEYWGYRALAYNNASMAQSCRTGGGMVNKLANQMGRIMKSIQIIEAIAKQRKISLTKKQ